MRRAWWLVSALSAIALTACTGRGEPPPDPAATPEVPARTSWVLSHRVEESATLRVTGRTIDHYGEGSSLSLGPDPSGLTAACSIEVFVPGQGGPKTMVGEKIPTTVNGSPGFRNGAGAEGPYVMWRYRRGGWAMAHCGSEGAQFLETITGAVSFRRTPMKLPLGLAPLPTGYGLSSVSSDSIRGSHAIYLGKMVAAFGHADADIVVSYETGDLQIEAPTGRATTVNGRPAVLGEDRESPGVCVAEQQRYVCVRAHVSDTGPFEDRRGEIPTLLTVAEGLRFAADLDDPSTWLDSDDALPP